MGPSQRKLIGTFLFLFAVIMLSFSFVGAVSSEEFQSFLDATPITVTVNQNSAHADFSINTSGYSFDHQEINIENQVVEDVTIDKLILSFDISEILNDVNTEIELKKDSNVPQFNSLSVTGAVIGEPVFNVERIEIGDISLTEALFTTEGFFNNIVNTQLNLGLDLDNVTTINNYLANNIPSITHNGETVFSDRNINFTKEGNDYVVWNDEGYGSLTEDWRAEIREAIEFGVGAINLEDIFDLITPFLEENGVDVIFDELEGINMDYSVTDVDLSSIQTLEDGNYIIPVTMTDPDGNIYQKDITLIVEGIQNADTGGSFVAGVYTPINQEIKYYLIKISGLGSTINSILIFDDDSVLPSNVLPSDLKNIIKYLDISSDASSGTIEFKVPVGNVENPELVDLYVLEGSSWDKLVTDYLGENSGFHEFSAETPHFSFFLIAEEEESTSSSSSSDSDDKVESESGGPRTTPTESPIEEPIDTGDTPEQEDQGFFSAITGAFIGAFGPGGSILVIVFVASLIALVIIIAIANRKSRVINEKGDQYEK